jgi:CRISPR/Cas system CSM-associated protein Csm3 (group 7 of RAMP superfamily)
MFRKLYNQAVLSGRLIPDGPVLIVQGGAALDPVAPDLAFVRTTLDGEPTVYLPGSSLKGVLRAHAERLLCTQLGESAAESPFENGPRRREAERLRKLDKPDRPGVFRVSCAADQLFGSTEIAGRFRIGDACPSSKDREAANRTEIRYGVAIDRAKQSVKHGPFEQEAVVGGSFAFKAVLENYELWMLSLVLQAFADLDDGLVQVGHAKSRGFGSMRLAEPVLDLRWPGEPPARLEGAGAREPVAAVRDDYGLLPDDAVSLPAGAEKTTQGLFGGYRFKDWDDVRAVLDACAAEPWRRFVARAREERHGP